MLVDQPTVCEWRPCQNLLRPPGGRGRPRKFCSAFCSLKARRDLIPQDSTNARRCGLDGCNRPHRAKDLCAPHWVAADRAMNGRKKEPWNDRARHAYHSRRAQKIGTATGLPVIFIEIADRDEWRCGICEELVNPLLKYPDPLSGSQDHIVPLSKGGIHDPGNVQLAHLRCNQAKNNSTTT